MRLTQLEEDFKNLNGVLALSPTFHHREKRIEAHIFVVFIGSLSTPPRGTNCARKLPASPQAPSSINTALSLSNQINDLVDVYVNGGSAIASGTETARNLNVNGAGFAALDAFTVSNNLTVSGSAAVDVTSGRTLTVNGTTNLSDCGNLTVHRSSSSQGAVDTAISLSALNITNASSGTYAVIVLDHGAGFGQNSGKVILNGDVTFTGNTTNSNAVLFDAVKGGGGQGGDRPQWRPHLQHRQRRGQGGPSFHSGIRR